MVSLLGGQFLADIEHICLGSVSYDSDTSSSVTSRSVGSIVSDASRASDGSRGCRPRVTNTTVVSRGHHFFPSHLSHLVQEHLLPESDHNFETQECLSEIQPSMDKDSLEASFIGSSHKIQCTYDPSDLEYALPDQLAQNYSSKLNFGESKNATSSEVWDKQTRGTAGGVHRPNTTSSENGKISDEDHEGKESNTVCNSTCIEEMTKHLQDHKSQGKDTKRRGKSASQTQSYAPEKNSSNDTEPQRELAEYDSKGEDMPQVSQPLKPQDEESVEGGNSRNDSGQGKEAQNAAALTHYLQKGCGAKILIALDQLGVSVSFIVKMVIPVH